MSAEVRNQTAERSPLDDATQPDPANLPQAFPGPVPPGGHREDDPEAHDSGKGQAMKPNDGLTPLAPSLKEEYERAGIPAHGAILRPPAATERDPRPVPLDLRRLQREGLPPIPWIAEPYLVEREIHLIVGDGSTRKSLLALDTALGLAAGQPVFLDCVPCRPYRVLYIDEDGSPLQAKRRILKLARGRGIDLQGEVADRLVVYSGEGFQIDPESKLKALEAVIVKHRPEVIFLDCLRCLHPRDENTSEDMAVIMRHALRPCCNKYGVALIVVHHASKGPAEWKNQRRSASQATRGSTEIRNGSDTLIFLENVSEGGPTKLMLDKTRHLDPSNRPEVLGFTATDGDDDSMRIVEVEIGTGGRGQKMARAANEILAALPEGSSEELTHKRLMARLPGLRGGCYKDRTARCALRELTTQRVFSRREEGNNVFYRRTSTHDSGKAAE